MANRKEIKRIAMWSGPRNLSTAMMYAFAQRPDCDVWDEPFYAAYLDATGIDHPMGDAIKTAGHSDPETVIAKCHGEGPSGRPVYYQKHMTQHMIPSFQRDWIYDLDNVFLIRHPAYVLASYAAKRDNPTLDDIGFTQQSELIDLVMSETGQVPIIVDSADVRNDPESMLKSICTKLEIPFYSEMLKWPTGGNPHDGVWAPHWYGSVWQSTGFAGPENALPAISSDLQHVFDAAKPIYDQMFEMRLRP